ncbi:hypothetical protein PLICRDRAFT_234457 [Plicaturopsis crispa FD-325 SS-3]|nr:hypothetical protein PLICRDRAFT_234457 [Plicaturopsis crispa FD-325 SS-3]
MKSDDPAVHALLHLPPHPFPNLLVANDAPSPADIPLIHQDTHLTEARMSALDAEAAAVDFEIAQLHDIATQLASTRTALQNRLDRNHGALSALLRLPSELLAHIFLDCLPDDASRRPATVLRLGSVCSRWWAVAQSTPRLWTSMYLGRRGPPLDAAVTWLRRSGGLPLTLECEGRASLDLAPLVVAYAERWTHLGLDTRDDYEQTRSEPVSGGFASLVSLSIDMGAGNEDVTLWDFTASPRLRAVSVSYAGAGTDDAPTRVVTLPWTQLTHLCLQNQTQGTCVDILSLSPNLVECDLRTIRLGFEHHPNAPSPPVHLPHLRHLRISYLSVDERDPGTRPDIWLLDSLATPALLDLDLSAPPTNVLREDSLLRLLQRSGGARLRRLGLDSVGTVEGELTPCLAYLSALQELDISGGVTLLDVRALECTEGQCALPALRVLRLDEFDVDLADFVRMLRSRWRQSHVQSVQPRVESAQPRVESVQPLALVESVQPLVFVKWRPEFMVRYTKSQLGLLRALKREGFNIDLPRGLAY